MKKNREKILEHYTMMNKMKDKHDVVYFDLFGKCMLEGMDIETAIYHCWNKLMAEQNGKG